MSPPPEVEVLIIGGGPAGSAAGIALASVGHRVCIVERRRFPRFRIGESLPPKVNPLLELLGVWDEVAAAGFVRMAGTTTARGGEPERHPFSEGGRQLGHQVERGRFDEILLQHAARAGCVVLSGRVEQLLVRAGRVEGVRVREEGAGAARTVTAAWVLDASGNQRVVARRLGLTRRSPEKTAALYARWAGVSAPPGLEVEDTLFEMQEDAWIWSVLLSEGVRSVTVGFDVGRLRGQGAEAIYRGALARSRLLRGVLERASLESPPKAHDATRYDASAYAGPGFLLLGDAGFFADPLTSQGVYKALHGGLVAASVVRTVARDPGDEAMALEFFDHSQRRLAVEYAEVARSFYAQSGFEESDFWRTRARVGREEPHGESGPGLAERSRRRAEFMEQVRTVGGERLALSRTEALRVELRAASVTGFIRRRPSFVALGRAAALSTIDTPPEVHPGRLYALLDGRAMSLVFEAYAEAVGVRPSSEVARVLLETLARLAEEGLIELRRSV